MKKLLSALVCLGLVISMGAVIGCGEKKETKPAVPADKDKDKDKAKT